MCDCASARTPGQGPFAEGRQLVEFVLQAHGGVVAGSAVPNGGLELLCHGCGAPFHLATFVQSCPACGGVHAVSPPRASDANAIQFAGADFRLPGHA